MSTALRMSSSEGKYKAFSTCSSNLSVVFLFYGKALGAYIISEITYSPRNTAVASLMCPVVPQMIFAFIYSPRNRDMKETLSNLIGRITSLMVSFPLVF
jgi:olfactory receptor